MVVLLFNKEITIYNDSIKFEELYNFRMKISLGGDKK
jgi:hypothetical protein